MPSKGSSARDFAATSSRVRQSAPQHQSQVPAGREPDVDAPAHPLEDVDLHSRSEGAVPVNERQQRWIRHLGRQLAADLHGGCHDQVEADDLARLPVVRHQPRAPQSQGALKEGALGVALQGLLECVIRLPRVGHHGHAGVVQMTASVKPPGRPGADTERAERPSLETLLERHGKESTLVAADVLVRVARQHRPGVPGGSNDVDLDCS
jgi:hypothetical protein